ncbi:MAG: DUF2851 family protein [Verrucomicrobia bacterium]|nr:DUF2851 family protein [Verrucomicrobiota bacterium]
MTQTRQVEELHGLYGTFTVSERVLQQIWLRQDFGYGDLRTASGKALEIIDSGSWNHGGGPDFKDASVRIGGELQTGDIEVHFKESDWELHGHNFNSGFDKVILHVVLHKTKRAERFSGGVKTKAGKALETFYLMPKLDCDLESYAETVALREMAAVDDMEWANAYMGLSEADRRAVLKDASRRRWHHKVRYAAKRLKSEGWSAACHQYLLEVLGYSQNRAPMSRIAQRYPLGLWETVAVGADEAYDSEKGYWACGGQRRANHPRRRLEDYTRFVSSKRNWPSALREELSSWPEVASRGSTSGFRRRTQLKDRQCRIHQAQFLKLAGKSRCNSAMVDAFLPLAQAEGLLESFGYWWHWPPGDWPDGQRSFLKQAGLCDRANLMCNGLAQGVLGLFLAGGWGSDCIDLP